MKYGERQRRDDRIVTLFVAGATYREIAMIVGLRSPQSVADVVRRRMDVGDERRAALHDFTDAVLIERREALLKAHWPKAMQGDYRAAIICTRLLDQAARAYGLLPGSGRRPTPAPATDDPIDELAEYRRRWGLNQSA